MKERKNCYGCAFAHLMDDGRGNPIIASCSVHGKRYAARVHYCAKFRQATDEPKIHPMIYTSN